MFFALTVFVGGICNRVVNMAAVPLAWIARCTQGSPAKKPNLMMHSQAVTDGLCPGTEVRVVRRETIKRECKEYRDSGLETTSLLLQTNLVEAWLPIEHLQRASDETAKQVKDSPATHKSMSFLPLVSKVVLAIYFLDTDGMMVY